MRLLICGDRYWTDYNSIQNEILARKDQISCIIGGGAKGADFIAKHCANKLGIPLLSFPANWKEYGKAAGPIRNKQMLVVGKPDLVLVFHNNLNESKGTRNMIDQAMKEGIAVEVISNNTHLGVH